MNETQLEQCIRDYGKELYAFCRRMTGSLQEAEDLYQDTFLKALELKYQINYEHNPKSYLASIALRLWKNKKRKYAWRSRIAGTEQLVEESANTEIKNTDGGSRNPVEEQYLEAELRHQVRQAVGELEEKYRVPIYLYYTLQLSGAEISKILKIPEGTVKTRLHKARKILKEKLEVVIDEI